MPRSNIRILTLAGLITLLPGFVTQALAAPPSVSIVDCSDSSNIHTQLGTLTNVNVKIESDVALGRIELRLEFDAGVITFLNAEPAGPLAAWEHFNWQHVADSNCEDSCRGGLRLLAVADLLDGDSSHPDPANLILSDRVISVTFLTTDNGNYLNGCTPVEIIDAGCGDLALFSASGDSVFTSTGHGVGCQVYQNKTVFEDLIVAGGTVCFDESWDCGDINLDGIRYNIADAVLFLRYFVEGPSVWDPVWGDVQKLCTDFNGDGVMLTISDLTFLIRRVTNGATLTTPPGPCP